MIDIDKLVNDISNPAARPDDLRAAAYALLERADELDGPGAAPAALVLLNIGEALENGVEIQVKMRREPGVGDIPTIYGIRRAYGLASERQSDMRVVKDVRGLWYDD